MNIEKQLKILGFDPNIIEDKQLKIEFVSLVEIFLDKYQLYGNGYDKNVYIKEEKKIVSETKNNKVYSVKKDETKQCKTISLFNTLTNKEYDLDVIYDEISKTYTILFKPHTLEAFSHDLFGSSFFIKYNTMSKEMISSMVSRTLEGDLLVDKYEFNNVCNGALLVVNTKSVYEGLSVIAFEKKYQKLYGILNLNNLYKPGDFSNCEDLVLKSRTSILSTNSTKNIQRIITDKIRNRLARFNFNNCVIVYRHGTDKYYRKTFSNAGLKGSLLSNMLVAEYSCKKSELNKQKEYN